MSALHVLNFDNNKNRPLEKEILAPFIHICQVKGKQLRLKIIQAFNHWLQVSEADVNKSMAIINTIHVACLIIDDIQDSTNLRRGMPAAHCLYGVPLTFNTALHSKYLAIEAAFAIDPEAAKILTEDFLEMCRGQGADIYYRENFICPPEDQYYKMLEQKTGYFFLMGVRLLQLFSTDKTDYKNIIMLLGRYFQIRDDYCNLRHQEALEEWPGAEEEQVLTANAYCEDIAEGKISLPVVHAVQKTSKGGAIMKILRQKTNDAQLKKYCVSLLEEAGSLEYTRQVLEKMDQEARAEVARLGGNPLLDEVLDELLSWKEK